MNLTIEKQNEIKNLQQMVIFAGDNIHSNTDPKMREYLDFSYKFFITSLAKAEEKDISEYEELLHFFDDKNEKKETNNYSCEDYVADAIFKNGGDISLKFKELNENLDEILEAPNDKLMETWANNFSDYCDRNSLDKKMIIEYLNSTLKVKQKDKENKYFLNENFEIEKNVNSKIADESIKIADESTKTEDESIKTENESTKADDESTKADDESTKTEDDIKENPEILTIRSCKKSKRTKAEAIALSGAALCFILHNGIVPIGIGICAIYGINRLIKNRKYKKSLMEIFEKYNITYDEDTNEIYDEYGNIVDENYADKEMYKSIRNELKNIEALKGKTLGQRIKEDDHISLTYQKNRLLSKIVNSKTYKNAKRFFQKNEYNVTDYANNYEEQDEEITNDISKKGMGGL